MLKKKVVKKMHYCGFPQNENCRFRVGNRCGYDYPTHCNYVSNIEGVIHDYPMPPECRYRKTKTVTEHNGCYWIKTEKTYCGYNKTKKECHVFVDPGGEGGFFYPPTSISDAYKNHYSKCCCYESERMRKNKKD